VLTRVQVNSRTSNDMLFCDLLYCFATPVEFLFINLVSKDCYVAFVESKLMVPVYLFESMSHFCNVICKSFEQKSLFKG
jgi:hypothetical protein